MLRTHDDAQMSSFRKQAFHFTNSDGTHDVYDAISTLDLRDEQWHDLKITFKANQANGLKFYVDGQLTYSDSNIYLQHEPRK